MTREYVMKKSNLFVAPIFTLVVLLLSIGAVYELFESLFEKSSESESEEVSLTNSELATLTNNNP
jgi:hypothetical protein